MSINFDKVIDRRGTDCNKWDLPIQLYQKNDLIGMRIADTDFPPPDNVLKALKDLVQHSIMGYGQFFDSHYNSICEFYHQQAQFLFSKDSISFTPGVTPAVVSAIFACTQEGDEVIIQTPAYNPLLSSIEANSRIAIKNALIYNEQTGAYQSNFKTLEKQITSRTKVWLFCHPHNPTGKVFSQEELLEVAYIAKKYDLIVISDEIHGFANFPEFPYIPLASISSDIESRTIMLSSPGKIFNIAGLVYAFSVITNPELNNKFQNEMFRLGLSFSVRNNIALKALKFAYMLENAEWLKTTMNYIQSNYEYLKSFLEEYLPKIKLTPSEGTFLTWLNFKGLNLTEQELEYKLIYEAGVVLLAGGTSFGTESEGFFRMNIGCSKTVLKQALEQIYDVFKVL